MMQARGEVGIGSSLGLKLIRSDGSVDYHGIRSSVPDNPDFPLAMLMDYGAPQKGLPEEVYKWRVSNFSKLFRGWYRARRVMHKGMVNLVDSLSVVVIRKDGEVLDYGLAAIDIVTTAGANFIRDAFRNLAECEDQDNQGLGTGTTAAAIGDTALQTEWAAGDYTGSVRASASYTAPQSKRAQLVATNTKASVGTSAVTELGILSSATVGSGTLLARFVFSAINLSQNDALQGTFNLDINDGG